MTQTSAEIRKRVGLRKEVEGRGGGSTLTRVSHRLDFELGLQERNVSILHSDKIVTGEE